MLFDYKLARMKAEKLTGDWRLRVTKFSYDTQSKTYSATVDSMSDAGISYRPEMKTANRTQLDFDCKCDGFLAKNLCWHCIALLRTVLESREKDDAEAPATPEPTHHEPEVVEPDEIIDQEPEVEPEVEELQEPDPHCAVAIPNGGEHSEIVSYAPAPMPDMPITQFRQRIGMIDQLVNELQEGTDFGKVAGIAKPFLHQPGAEKLQVGFNVVPIFTIIEQEVDHDRMVPLSKWWKALDPQPKRAPANYQELKKQGKMRCVPSGPEGNKTFTYYEAIEEEGGASIGFYRYVVKCELRSRANGSFVGEAMAICSSLETKYIRNARNAENTILQMAQKRASVRVTRTALGLSDRFTQDPDIVENQGH